MSGLTAGRRCRVDEIDLFKRVLDEPEDIFQERKQKESIKIQRKYRYAQGQLRGRIEKKERKKAGGK